MWYFARASEAYITTAELANASAGETAPLTLINPSGSGVTAVFAPIEVSTLGQSISRVYDTFDTAPSGGADATVENVILDSDNGSPDDGEVTARTGDSYTAASTHAAMLLGGGEGGVSVGGRGDMPLLAIEPGRSAVVEVEKLASGPDDVVITARWFEVPQVFSKEPVDSPLSELYD
jgi:hypothetical protein